MQAAISAGSALNYELAEALLIYTRSGGAPTHLGAFLTRHEVGRNDDGTTFLKTGQLLDRTFVEELLTGLRGAQPVEILPENVLARTPERMAWWVKPSPRTMYYAVERSPELEALSGVRFPQPSLVFDVAGNGLRVRALASNERPTKDTPLYHAPYWNVYDNGAVCLGSTPVPQTIRVETMDAWVEAFFVSRFSHQNAHERLTTHPKGFIGLWRELAGKKRFSARYLAPAHEMLGEFLR